MALTSTGARFKAGISLQLQRKLSVTHPASQGQLPHTYNSPTSFPFDPPTPRLKKLPPLARGRSGSCRAHPDLSFQPSLITSKQKGVTELWELHAQLCHHPGAQTRAAKSLCRGFGTCRLWVSSPTATHLGLLWVKDLFGLLLLPSNPTQSTKRTGEGLCALLFVGHFCLS